MIRELSIKNFKSWKNIEKARFSRLTGFFGANSSGKTSILQFLLLLKQSVESTDRAQVLNFGTERDYVELGSFRDIITDHKEDETLSSDIKLSFKDEINISNYELMDAQSLYIGNKAAFNFNILQNEKKYLYIDSLSYKLGKYCFYLKKQLNNNIYRLSETNNLFQFIKIPDRNGDLPEPIRFYGFPDQVRNHYHNIEFLFDLQLLFEEFFSGLYYLGPLREFPKRNYSWVGRRPSDVGQRGGNYIEALLASRIDNRQIYTVEERVAYWLKKLELIDSFTIKEVAPGSNIYQVWVKKNPTGSEVLITDVGFGVSQILPVLTLCYYVPEGSTILIEQPEIHLHPKVQAGLADVFIDAIKTKNIQIILESHSEHLLTRLQRRMAEEKIGNQDIALYFCENKNSHSQLVPLETNEYGQIKNWPENFFGNEMEEIYETNEAIMRRKLGS